MGDLDRDREEREKPAVEREWVREGGGEVPSSFSRASMSEEL